MMANIDQVLSPPDVPSVPENGPILPRKLQTESSRPPTPSKLASASNTAPSNTPTPIHLNSTNAGPRTGISHTNTPGETSYTEVPRPLTVPRHSSAHPSPPSNTISSTTIVGLAIGGTVMVFFSVILGLAFCYYRSRSEGSKKSSNTIYPSTASRGSAPDGSYEGLMNAVATRDQGQATPDSTVPSLSSHQSPCWDVHPAYRRRDDLLPTRRFSTPPRNRPPLATPPDRQLHTSLGIYSADLGVNGGLPNCNLGWDFMRRSLRYPPTANNYRNCNVLEVEVTEGERSAGSSILEYCADVSPEESKGENAPDVVALATRSMGDTLSVEASTQSEEKQVVGLPLSQRETQAGQPVDKASKPNKLDPTSTAKTPDQTSKS